MIPGSSTATHHGLPTLRDSSRASSSALSSITSASFRRSSIRSFGVLSRQRLPRLLGGSDGAIDVLLAGPRHLGDHLAGGRVEYLHRLAGQGVDELAVDEHLLLGDRNAHLFLRTLERRFRH